MRKLGKKGSCAEMLRSREMFHWSRGEIERFLMRKRSERDRVAEWGGGLKERENTVLEDWNWTSTPSLRVCMFMEFGRWIWSNWRGDSECLCLCVWRWDCGPNDGDEQSLVCWN